MRMILPFEPDDVWRMREPPELPVLPVVVILPFAFIVRVPKLVVA